MACSPRPESAVIAEQGGSEGKLKIRRGKKKRQTSDSDSVENFTEIEEMEIDAQEDIEITEDENPDELLNKSLVQMTVASNTSENQSELDETSVVVEIPVGTDVESTDLVDLTEDMNLESVEERTSLGSDNPHKVDKDADRDKTGVAGHSMELSFQNEEVIDRDIKIPDVPCVVDGDKAVDDLDQTQNATGNQVLKRRGRPPYKKDGARIQLMPGPSPGESDFHEELLALIPKPGIVTFTQVAHERLKELMMKRKSLKCPKAGCGKSYSLLASFKYHITRCGVKIEFPCDQCSKIYKSENGLKYHMDSTHSTKPETNLVHEDEHVVGDVGKKPELSRTGNVSRYGRHRVAVERFENIMEDGNPLVELDECDEDSDDDGDDGGGGDDDDDDDGDISIEKIRKESGSVTDSEKWMEYIEVIRDTDQSKKNLTTSGEVLERLASEAAAKLKKKKSILCPHECGLRFMRLARLKKHLLECTGTVKRRFRCKLCEKMLFTLSGMRRHVKEKHRRLKAKSDDESEYSAGEQVCPPNVKPKRLYKPQTSSEKYWENTKAWCRAFHRKLVFPGWKPTLNHWNKLSLSEVGDYLPVRKVSPCFSIQPATIYIEETYRQYQLPVFTSVPMVTSAGHLCSLTFYVGGPVWAMDWVPIPEQERKKDQYLAIGCHRDSEQLHSVAESYKEKSVLQIWRIPKLKNKKSPTALPEFCLGIAFDYGPVWDIRFCPSGAWEELTETPGNLRRLGLLALACADGKVRILSVPFPKSLTGNDAGTANHESLIFRATPHAELSPGSACRIYRGECGPVWSVEWLPLGGHKKIIGCYGDGTVAIWDLTTENRLLKLKASNGLSERNIEMIKKTRGSFGIREPLKPARKIEDRQWMGKSERALGTNRWTYAVRGELINLEAAESKTDVTAHCSAVRALAWCPSDPNYIATGGYDRLIKIWDLRCTSQPLTYLKRGFSYQFAWSIHWASLVFCSDNLLNKGASGARVFDYFYNSRSDDNFSEHPTNSINPHNSATWGADYSNWLNMLASVDAAGEVQLNLLGGCHVRKNHHKRTPIFRASFEEVSQSNVADGMMCGQITSHGTSKNGISLNDPGRRDSYTLIFKDTHPMFASKSEQKRLDKDTQVVDVDKPTYAAQHKVRWNPNVTSYFWLATGGRAGIVRICHVEEMDGNRQRPSKKSLTWDITGQWTTY